MKVDENINIVYHVCYSELYIGTFNTRKEANDFIDDRDDHGYDTTLWSVIPEAVSNEW